MSNKKVILKSPFSDVKQLNCYLKDLVREVAGEVPPFKLYTQDSNTIDHEGEGTQSNPLISYSIVSSDPFNSLEARGSGLYVRTTILDGIISGGIVTWIDDYNYHVSPALYNKGGVQYDQSIDFPDGFDFTLTNPDVIYNRLDSFVINVGGPTVVLEGVPSDNPTLSEIDPATQLFLSFALVEVGTTQPTITTECIYRNNAEWATAVSNVVKFNPDSILAPCSGAKSVEATSIISNDYISFVRSLPFTPAAAHSQLHFLIRSKSSFLHPQNLLRFQWYNGGTPVGAPALFRHGSFSFNSANTVNCQIIAIPLTYFGLTSTTSVDELRITGSVQISTIAGFFIDDLCLQGQPLPAAPSAPDEKVKISSVDTVAGYLFDKLHSVDGSVTMAKTNVGSNERLNLQVNIDAESGLRLFSPGVIRLGGDLLQDETIEAEGFGLVINDSVGSANGALRVTTIAGGNTGIRSSAAGLSTAIVAIAESGTALAASAVNGTAVSGNSTNGFGGAFSSDAGIASVHSIIGASGNTVSEVVRILKQTTDTPAIGLGARIGFWSETDTTSLVDMGYADMLWSNVTHATHTAQYDIYLKNNSVLQRKLSIAGSGQVTFDQYGDNLFTGTPTRYLAVDVDGKLIEVAIPTGSTYTVDNGLDEDPSGNFQLGGPLTKLTTIDAGTLYKLALTGDVPIATQSGVLSVHNTNTSNTGHALSVTLFGTNGIATSSIASGSGVGVFGQTATGTGVFGYASSNGVAIKAEAYGFSSAIDAVNVGTGIGISVLSAASLAGVFVVDHASNNNVAEAIRIIRTTSDGAGALNGIGTSLSFSLENTAGFATETARIEAVLSNATSGALSPQLSFYTVNAAGTPIKRAFIYGSGGWNWSGYGSGSVTADPPAFGLAVDPDGNVIEIALGGGGGGTVNSVAGTANRITSTGGTDPVIDISASYIGQASITTVGTLTSGATGAGFTIALGTSTITGDLPFANLTQGAALSVLGVTGNAGADVASIAAGSDGVILRRSGTTLSFGSIDLASANAVGSSVLDEVNGGTGQSSWTAGQILYASGVNTLAKLSPAVNGQVLTLVAGLPAWQTVTGTGTVTFIGMNGGTTGLTFSPGSISTTGTFTMSGTLAVTNGGTGLTTIAQGSILYGSASNVFSALAKSTTATRYLANTGASNNPQWDQVNLSNGVTGDLPFSNLTQIGARSVLGVTGNVTADVAGIQGTTDQILRINTTGTALAFGSINLAVAASVGTSILRVVNGGTGQATYTNGQLLIGNTVGNTLAKATLTEGNAITITNGNGSITISYKYLHTPISLTDLSTTTWNVTLGENATWPIGNTNRVLVISNAEPGRHYNLKIVPTINGATVGEWPTGTKWVGGPPTIPGVAGQIFAVSFYCDAAGSFLAVPSDGAFV